MDLTPQRRTDPDGWIDQIFSAGAARRGGVVRRSTDWVEREIGVERLELEVRRRGFHMVSGGGQMIIICCNDPVRIIC